MTADDRIRIARETYAAYETGDRSLVERHLSEGFVFRNTEVLTFDEDDKLCRAEVYFGWDLGDSRADSG